MKRILLLLNLLLITLISHARVVDIIIDKGIYEYESASIAGPEINVRGNNNSIANGTITTSLFHSTDFEWTFCSTNLIRTFLIENTGDSDLIFTDTAPNFVSIIGSSDFTVLSQPSSNVLPAGASVVINIMYTGTITGSSASATVSIASNDSDEPVYTFAIEAETREQEVTANFGNIFCQGYDIIRVSNTESAVNYYLRDDADDSIVDGPVLGVGESQVVFNTGTITETKTYNVFAENLNRALDFDGVDDYITIPDTPSLNPTNGITLEAWVKLDALGQRQIIIDKSSTNPLTEPFSQYHLEINANNEIYFSISLNGAMHDLETTNVGLVANHWHHIAVTWDNNKIFIFKDGVKYNEVYTGSQTIDSYATSLNIGGQPITNTYGTAIINDVRIWDIARSQVEIQRFRYRTFDGTETGLVGTYDFNEGAGIIANDKTANANHGTLTNMNPATDWVAYDNLNCLGELHNTITVTVEELVNAPITILDPKICDETTSTIEIETQQGVTYFIRDGDDNTFLASLFGDGSVISIEIPVVNKSIPLRVFQSAGAGCFNNFTYSGGKIVKLIKDQTVIIGSTIPNQPIIVSMNSSEVGVDYYLRDDLDDTIIVGPITGTGSQLDFIDPIPLVGYRGYNVLAEKYATGLTFDGIDDAIVTAPIDFSSGNTMTIEAWIKPNDITTNPFYEISRQQSGTGIANLDWLFAFQDNGAILSFGLRTTSGYNELDISITATDYTDGNWHHVAAVYDGANRYVYLDGNLIGADSKTGNITFNATQHAIGSSPVTPVESFDGAIDELRFWNTVKTQTDIQNTMNMPLEGNESGLIGYYNFDEASGLITRNLVTGNNQVLTNMDAITSWTKGAFQIVECQLEILDQTYILQGGSSVISSKVFLQGAFINPIVGEETLMRDNLRDNGLLPTTSPYSDSLTCAATVFNRGGTSGVGTIANDIVDWVWVELRSATDNTIVIASRSALLQRDGDVVDIDGRSLLVFYQNPEDYFVAIKHRNHLGIINTNALTSNSAVFIDFTNDNNQITFGTNAQTTFGMPNGVVAMWAGDTNGDGRLNYSGALSDVPGIRSQVFNDPNNSVFGGPPVASYPSQGYYGTDVDMNGVTIYSGTVSDVSHVRNNIFNNPSNSIFGGPPTSTYLFTQQLPEGAN
ncbi:LamG-like jellyroll fold domain-containing protein [uncultured Lacinutrix sp.]|uniref:LamG-like jellyroll fold domain-containing protein n=1 Tax=uncultured Lacinutrix sp. TaxID=574032 RepID=UPI00263692F5|nr:LamG-like jellyroll fold domain-containing protein [uncultured Lacinutrix sp.]